MLFKTAAELIQFTDATNNINIASLRPSITYAEVAYIIPFIGRALYAELNSAYKNVTPLTEDTPLGKLLPVVQQALAPFILNTFTPKGEISWTDGGTRRLESANAKSAYQYQVTNARLQLKEEGLLHTESLITFLEENKAEYPLWTASPEFRQYRSLFIKTSSEFNDQVLTSSPGRNYLLMRSTMADVEEQVIKKLLGKAFYGMLKTKAATANPAFTDDETDLLQKLKKLIAYLTLVKAIPLLNVKIDERGLTVYGSGAMASRDDDSKREAASKDAVNELLTEMKENASGWLTTVKEHLLETASPTIFPEYYAFIHPPTSTNAPPIQQTCGGAYGLT